MIGHRFWSCGRFTAIPVVRLFCLSLLTLTASCTRPEKGTPPASDVAPERVSVSGFGRGYTNAALKTMIQRSVDLAIANHIAEGHAPEISAHALWAFAVQTNISNKPETLITASFTNGGIDATQGFLRTATLGTSPPVVFIGEIERFVHRLIHENGTQKL